MTAQTKKAGFWIRALAQLIEIALFWLLSSWYLSYVSSSQDLSTAITRLIAYLTFVILLLLVRWLLYSPLLTYYLGGGIGKLLTGLRVRGFGSHQLTLKRIFFRQIIGYCFSFTLVGLGYWSVLKDKDKRAWHDKAVGSQVVTMQPLWPLGLAVLIGLLYLNFILFAITLSQFNQGPLPGQITNLIRLSAQEQKNKQHEHSTPSPSPFLIPASSYTY